MTRAPRRRTTSLTGPPERNVPGYGTRLTNQDVLRMELHRSSGTGEDDHQVAVEVVRVFGEIDLSTVGQLAAALAELVARPAARVVVDVSEVTFCGLRGLGALHDGARLATARSTGFVIVGLSPQLVRLSRELWPSPHPLVGSDRAAAVAMLVADAAPRRLRLACLPEPPGGRPAQD